jgi:hypothetical protein
MALMHRPVSLGTHHLRPHTPRGAGAGAWLAVSAGVPPPGRDPAPRCCQDTGVSPATGAAAGAAAPWSVPPTGPPRDHGAAVALSRDVAAIDRTLPEAALEAAAARPMPALVEAAAAARGPAAGAL